MPLYSSFLAAKGPSPEVTWHRGDRFLKDRFFFPVKQGTHKVLSFLFPSKDCSQNSSLIPSVERTLVQASDPSCIHTFISQNIHGQGVCCSPFIQVLVPAHLDSYLLGKAFLVSHWSRMSQGSCTMRSVSWELGICSDSWILSPLVPGAPLAPGNSREQMKTQLGTIGIKENWASLVRNKHFIEDLEGEKKWEGKNSSLLPQR